MLKKAIIIIAAIFLIAAIIEFKLVYVDRAAKRKKYYAMAQQKALQTKKPLLVIGDPATDNYSLTKFDYGCGDVCMDINDCPLCPTAVKHDINNGFDFLGDNSCVVFVSCTLEYANDINGIYRQLVRISGGDVYIVTITPNSLKTRFARNLGYNQFNRKHRILKAPPEYNTFEAVPFKPSTNA